METPVVLESLNPRSRDDIAAMAVAVQANVAALKVAWSKRLGIPSEQHAIQTPPPGAVRRYRETLIDRHVVAAYGDEELALRLRQVWGEFGVLCWVFGFGDPHHPPDFSNLSGDRAMHCPVHMQTKLEDVQKGLWRLRWEQRFRLEPAARQEPGFQREYEEAMATPMNVYGQSVRVCGNQELLLCACEYAGMLAALRWAIDDRWEWEGKGIMELMLGNRQAGTPPG